MPNHVTTICTITGDESVVAIFRAAMLRTEKERGEDRVFLDFNQAIAMPVSVSAVEENAFADHILAVLVQGPGLVEAWKGLQSWDRQDIIGPWKGLFSYERGELVDRIERAFPGQIANARKMALAIAETGHKSWYDWSIANWGTKWNSYDFSIKSEAPFTIQFDTAWSFPEPVFRKMAEMFPGLRFEVVSFDEGWNFACEGCFNGEPPFQKVKATDELYERVYGEKPDHGDDEAAA